CRAARRRSWARSRGAIRMAMSCLALPVFGRPTRRARFSSALVDSGMSEKSMRLSGICFPLLAARLASADDANRFRAILLPPQRVYDQGECDLRQRSQVASSGVLVRRDPNLPNLVLRYR